MGEEVQKLGKTLHQLTQELADMICRRAELGKNYGVILVPEGLIEFVPEVAKLIQEINEILAQPFEGDIRQFVLANLSEESKKLCEFLPRSISDQLLLDRDPHGNVQVSKIDTERLCILLLKDELEQRAKDGTYKGSFYPQAHFFGYEGRCALPSTLDSQYCYALGMNAALLVKNRASGYMSCVKNISEKDPTKWVAAGCPLPTMMNVERRKGKDVPVIKKALVELDGGVFKAFDAVREKWAILDCYRSPGPIQFQGASSDSINFLVKAPEVEQLLKETAEQEEWEKNNIIVRGVHNLSVLSRARIEEPACIP